MAQSDVSGTVTLLEKVGLAVRDIGFPIVMSLVLLYAVVVRFPDVLERFGDRVLGTVRESSLQHAQALERLSQRLEEIARDRGR